MSTPVLMFMNMKGGVGKTTLAIEIGWALAHNYDKDVLLIDYDAQANASFALLGQSAYFQHINDGQSMSNCLMPDVKPNDPFSVVGTSTQVAVDVSSYGIRVRNWYYPADLSKKAGSFSIIPGNLEMMRLALNSLPPESESRIFGRWESLIRSAKDAYDCVVVDCHPAGSFFTRSALLKSDAVVIPVTTDGFAATGLNLMRNFIEQWEPAGGASAFSIVFNNVNNSWDYGVEATIRNNQRFADYCLDTNFNYSNLFRNLAARRKVAIEQPVANKYKIGAMLRKVTDELVAKLQGHNC